MSIQRRCNKDITSTRRNDVDNELLTGCALLALLLEVLPSRSGNGLSYSYTLLGEIEDGASVRLFLSRQLDASAHNTACSDLSVKIFERSGPL